MESPAEKSPVDAINKCSYAGQSVVDWYQKLDLINRAEEVIFSRLKPLIKDGKLLDLGVGGGRTTKYLLEISEDYTGIDYTPQCVELVKRKYPAANLLCADARDLTIFGDAIFDLALFAFNGIDYMAHDDRLQALNEIFRVLKPGRFFVFSTHNRDYQHFNKLPWQEETRLSLAHLKSCLYTLAHWPRHLVMRKHEVYEDEYAIVNDTAHGFAMLTYYISINKQVTQLRCTGYTTVESYDMTGKRIENDTCFPWTYYLAQKPNEAR